MKKHLESVAKTPEEWTIKINTPGLYALKKTEYGALSIKLVLPASESAEPRADKVVDASDEKCQNQS